MMEPRGQAEDFLGEAMDCVKRNFESLGHSVNLEFLRQVSVKTDVLNLLTAITTSIYQRKKDISRIKLQNSKIIKLDEEVERLNGTTADLRHRLEEVLKERDNLKREILIIKKDHSAEIKKINSTNQELQLKNIKLNGIKRKYEHQVKMQACEIASMKNFFKRHNTGRNIEDSRKFDEFLSSIQNSINMTQCSVDPDPNREEILLNENYRLGKCMDQTIDLLESLVSEMKEVDPNLNFSHEELNKNLGTSTSPSIVIEKLISQIRFLISKSHKANTFPKKDSNTSDKEEYLQAQINELKSIVEKQADLLSDITATSKPDRKAVFDLSINETHYQGDIINSPRTPVKNSTIPEVCVYTPGSHVEFLKALPATPDWLNDIT